MAEIEVTQPTDEQLEEMGVKSWPIWSCEVSRFDWQYDQPETCYILEGQVTVTAGDQQVSFGAGDLVVFPAGLECVWDVTQPVRKHYKLG
ncbi:MAG: cupin [Planctomycetales bacterium 4484_123]|nr:MAG: cupin [Planctomycetales bacterium 4484_123]